MINRSGVEDTKLEAKDTNKIQGQGQPFQGQTLSRPRTQAQVLSKKKSSKIFFQAISNSIGVWYPEFLIGGGLNHKSHAMTSLKFSKEELFLGQRYCWMEDLKLLPFGS